MTKKEYDYIIPSHMLCAIEYGDYTGISDDDEIAIDRFLESLPKGNRILSYGTVSHFTHRNDVLGSIGCDCVDATLTVLED